MFRQIISKTIFSSHRSVFNQEITKRYLRRAHEPGIRKRLETFSEDFVENDPETIESMEADFMNVHEAHKQFESEEIKRKQTVASHVVRRKYFSEKNLNFLTWSEKEQIRMLNKNYPEEWPIEKLSESFPADPLTISKIIRNYWQPKDEKRVQKHDETVRKNWEMYRNGEATVDPMLNAHLKKFAHRDLNEVSKPKVNRKLGIEIPKPRSNEFSSIITTCKKYQEKEEEKPKDNLLESNEYQFPKRPRDSENDSVVLQGKFQVTNKWMPLSEYQKYSPDIVIEQPKAASQPENQQIFMKNVKKFEEPGVVSLSIDESKVYKALDIKEQITIPKKLWSKGQTYKVDDCFYDNDGEFLYRVPGLK